MPAIVSKRKPDHHINKNARKSLEIYLKFREHTWKTFSSLHRAQDISKPLAFIYVQGAAILFKPFLASLIRRLLLFYKPRLDTACKAGTFK